MPPNESLQGGPNGTEPGFKCKTCSKKFLLQGNLMKHEATAHSDKPFNCKLCNKGFHQEANLVAHEKVHNLGGMSSQLSSIKIPKVQCCSKFSAKSMQTLRLFKDKRLLYSFLIKVPKKPVTASASDSDEDMPALMVPITTPVCRSMKETALTGEYT